MKKILFYGNFGLRNEIVSNGQTSKTRNFYYLFREKFPEKTIDFFNTSGFKEKPLMRMLELNSKLRQSDILVIFPGGLNNLKLIINFLKLYPSIKVYYPIVGGWLADEIKNNNKIISALMKFECLYPETKGLQDKLNLLGIKNTKISSVFTLRKMKPISDIIGNYLAKKNDEIKLVYFGRVSEYKGVYIAMDAVKKNNCFNNKKWSLDIFGKLQDEENAQKFRSYLDDKIRYHGPLADDKIDILGEYDFFVFPTFYRGEGFPATCVESLMYGTPIIASNWAYNKEIIEDGKNGFIFELGDDNLYNKICDVINSDCDIINMKINAYNSSLKYTPEIAIKPFIDDMTEEFKNE